MVVRLTGDWTDTAGLTHHAGETVEVDASTLAQLEALGVVDTGSLDGGEAPQWPGLT